MDPPKPVTCAGCGKRLAARVVSADRLLHPAAGQFVASSLCAECGHTGYRARGVRFGYAG